MKKGKVENIWDYKEIKTFRKTILRSWIQNLTFGCPAQGLGEAKLLLPSKRFKTFKREVKTFLLKSKRIQKRLEKKINPNDLITKATNNLDKTRYIKYRFTPNQVKEKSLEGNSFVKLCNFHTQVKVKGDEDRVLKHEKKRRL